MKPKLIIKSIAVLSAIAISAIAIQSNAQTNYGILGKHGGVIYLGAPPGTNIGLEYSGLPKRVKRSAKCGVIRLNDSSVPPNTNGFKIGDETYPYTLNSVNTVTCSKGVLKIDGQSTIATPGLSWQTSSARFFAGSGSKTIFFLGASRIRVVRANSCGLARVTNSSTWPFSAGSIDSSVGDFTPSSVEAIAKKPRCKNGQLQLNY